MSTDAEWELWGLKDPYYGVITDPRFRNGQLTPQAREDFFLSGIVHVNHVMAACRHHVDPGFKPARVLDFGCGVGRLLIAFAAQAQAVVGLDISDAMLAEARRNCDERALRNVALLKSDDGLTALQGQFDLVHSAIVLQHIDPARGTRLFGRLLDHLAPGGLGAIQVTYGKTVFAAHHGLAPPVAPPEPPSLRRQLASWLESLGPARNPGNALPSAGEPPRDPEMQMNSYNLNALLFLMQTVGVTEFHTQLTDHGGELGVFLFFRKPRDG